MFQHRGRTIESYRKSVDKAQEALWVAQETGVDGFYIETHAKQCEPLIRQLTTAKENLSQALQQKEMREQIEFHVLQVIEAPALSKWWITPLPAFSNITPKELLETNYGENLLIYTKQYTR